LQKVKGLADFEGSRIREFFQDGRFDLLAELADGVLALYLARLVEGTFNTVAGHIDRNLEKIFLHQHQFRLTLGRIDTGDEFLLCGNRDSHLLLAKSRACLKSSSGICLASPSIMIGSVAVPA
jgi:hypothetical protein